MRIRFWGTRGSIPTPGPATVRYGGNTSCVEITSDAGTLLVVDCGTGARALGERLAVRSAGAGRPLDGSILVGHTHWDHIHGLPFFAPLFVPGGRWALHGPRGLGQSLAATLAGQMEYTYFPVALEHLAAEIAYHDLVEGVLEIGDATVRTQYLNHPALTLGYRIEVDGWTVVYASDHEPHAPELAAGGDLLASAGDARHVAFLDGADVVIHDTQYLAQEYEHKVGWGHSTVEYAVDAARLAGAGHLVLYHHDPSRHDGAVDEVLAMARRRAGHPLTVTAAAEGAVIDLGRRARSNASPTSGRSAVLAPAIEDLAGAVVVAVSDPEAGPAIRAAVEAEGLQLIEAGAEGTDGTPSAARLVVVADATALPHTVLSAMGAGGQDRVALLAVARRLPGAGELAGVTDWLVWPCTIAHVRTKLRAAVLRRACRWQAAPVAPQEQQRLAALRELALLDTPPEDRFDRYTELACQALSVPIALVTLVDADRQWFKSRRGITMEETPRDESLCAHAILGAEAFHVPDLLADPRFADSPAVTGEARVRSYAGVPLVAGGSRIGTLCVADHRPRMFNDEQLEELRRIARLVEDELVRPPA